MIESFLQYANYTLIVSCTIMSLIFCIQPIPKLEGLRNYRFSLRLLASAYFLLSLLTIMDIIQGSQSINYPIALTATSFQSIIFFYSLTVLLDSQFVRNHLVIKLISPTLLYILLQIILERIFGFPSINTIDDLLINLTHPTVMLNAMFLFYCIIQLFILIYLFYIEVINYDNKLHDYYADTTKRHLLWVRYLFIGASIFCVIILISLILNNNTFSFFVIAVNSVFYIVFGVFYIRYPLIFSTIEPIMAASLRPNNEQATEVNFRRYSWHELKERILSEKFYLNQDLNIEKMAEFLQIGRTSLSNYINREEDISFHTWINNLRIEEAKKMIINHPDYSIAKVAEHVGFSESSNFSRQFKLDTGKSPSVWKKEQLASASEI